jgi:hypothetical protein
VFDLTTQIQVTSSLLTRPTLTQTHHIELGYDASEQLVVNIWPTSTGGSAGNDAGAVSVIRLAGGNVTVFDQSGAPIPYAPPVSGAPTVNPLALLGANPGSSILSQLLVSNIQQQAQTTQAQLTYSGADALLSGTMPSGGAQGTAQWTYAQSGSLWVATQVTFSLARSGVSLTRTLQFANTHWNDNATNDAARAHKGSTALIAVINQSSSTRSRPVAGLVILD